MGVGLSLEGLLLIDLQFSHILSLAPRLGTYRVLVRWEVGQVSREAVGSPENLP